MNTSRYKAVQAPKRESSTHAMYLAFCFFVLSWVRNIMPSSESITLFLKYHTISEVLYLRLILRVLSHDKNTHANPAVVQTLSKSKHHTAHFIFDPLKP
jgi:hypothetical protein